jgi:hypothetical protein
MISDRLHRESDGPPAIVDTILSSDTSALQAARALLDQVPFRGSTRDKTPHRVRRPGARSGEAGGTRQSPSCRAARFVTVHS